VFAGAINITTEDDQMTHNARHYQIASSLFDTTCELSISD